LPPVRFPGSSASTIKPGSGRVFGPEVTFGRTIADAMEMQKDNLHFTGQGYIDLGHAYAQAYLNTPGAYAKAAGPAEDSGAVGKPEPSGVIDASRMIVSSSDGSLSFSTFDQKGHPAWHPVRTVDGSGLEDGEHGSDTITWSRRSGGSTTFLNEAAHLDQNFEGNGRKLTLTGRSSGTGPATATVTYEESQP
jgi:hypothetical protein